MARGIDTDFGFIPCERGRLFSRILSQTIPGAAVLAMSVLFGVWILYLRPADTPHATHPAHSVAAPAAVPAAAVASNPYGGLFDPRPLSGSTPLSLARNFPLELNLKTVPAAPSAAIAEQEPFSPAPANAQFAESPPLPVPRPAGLGSLADRSPLPASGRRLAQQNRPAVPPSATADNHSFFDKLFGALPRLPGPMLAYAAPEDAAVGNARGLASSPSPRYDRWTAVYDVSAHTVYLPNGTRLEAHSGLGNRLDDPNYVHERMRGATPPNVYELAPREALFHGVQALRLTPVGGGTVYGRTGLLAHTYMLGPNGDSNGCVSFRNYNAFLQAYQNGEIKRLAVVARLN